MKKIFYLIVTIPLLLTLANCGGKKKAAPEKKTYALFTKEAKPEVVAAKPTPLVVKTDDARVPEIDFEVENQTGKTIYVTCFSYIQKVDIFLRGRRRVRKGGAVDCVFRGG